MFMYWAIPQMIQFLTNADQYTDFTLCQASVLLFPCSTQTLSSANSILRSRQIHNIAKQVHM